MHIIIIFESEKEKKIKYKNNSFSSNCVRKYANMYKKLFLNFYSFNSLQKLKQIKIYVYIYNYITIITRYTLKTKNCKKKTLYNSKKQTFMTKYMLYTILTMFNSSLQITKLKDEKVKMN